MRIVCAPDSFKESLSATHVAQAMAAGVIRAKPDATCDSCPLGDGGEGTMEALVTARGGTFHTVEVTGPLGDRTRARLGMVDYGRTGVIELAQAAGLALVPIAKRNPARTTTHGVGELMRAAMDRGCDEIIVCLGGSATVDGGAGIAQVLGSRFFDADGRLNEQPMCGALLAKFARIDESAMILPRSILAACDVNNPLCGPTGAAAVFGPQKGATPQQVIELDAALAHFASIVGGDVNVPGAGAAGGAGFGLMSLCGARLVPGIELVLDAVGFNERCRGADLVLTGEGRLDAQSLHGKTCMGVARRAAALGVPTIAIVGTTGPGANDCTNPTKGGALRSFVSLSDRFGMDCAMREPARLIELVTHEIVRDFKSP